VCTQVITLNLDTRLSLSSGVDDGADSSAVFLEDLCLVNLIWEANKQELEATVSRVDDTLKDLDNRVGIMEAVVTVLHALGDFATALCLSLNFLIDKRLHVKYFEALLNKTLGDLCLSGNSSFTSA
jgi:hypothetical protein